MQVLKISESTSANRRIPVKLVDSVDGFSAEIGMVASAGEIKISKNGAAEANHAGTFTEIGGGLYYYQFTQGELDTAGFISFRMNKTGCRQYDFVALVGATSSIDMISSSYGTMIESIDNAIFDMQEDVTSIAADVTTVDGVVDSIYSQTTTIGLTTNTIASDLVTVDGIADTILADTNDIQTRLPAALVSGRMDSSVGAMAANTLTASALATDAVTEIQSGLATQASVDVIDGNVDTINANVDTIDTNVDTTITNLGGVQTDVTRLLGGRVTPYRGKMGANNEAVKFNFDVLVEPDDTPTLSAVYYRAANPVFATGVTLNIASNSNYDGYGIFEASVTLATTNLAYGDLIQVFASFSIDASPRQVIVAEIHIRDVNGREDVNTVYGLAEELIGPENCDDAFFERIATDTAAEIGDVGGSASITVSPISATVVNSLQINTIRDIVIFEDSSSPAIVWSITDANEDPVDLSGKTIRCVWYDSNEITHTTKQTGGSGITISGDDNNVVTMTYTTTDTATPKSLRYNLWNITDNLLLQYGNLTIAQTQIE